MGYRITRITNYYPQYLKAYYSNNPNANRVEYAHQYESLVNDSSEIASSYSKNLNKIAGVHATDIISNADILQNRWKTEHNLPDSITKSELILRQIAASKPDVVWIDDFSFFNEEWKVQLLKEVPSVKLLTGHVCAPYNTEAAEKFKLLDILFTCIPCFKKEFEDMGIKTYLLYHGFESSVLDHINQNNKFTESDVLFSGSLYSGPGFHNTRIELVEKLLASNIKIDLYCNLEDYKKVMLKKTAYVVLNLFQFLGLKKMIVRIPFLRSYKAYSDVPIKYYSKELIGRANKPVFGQKMYQLMSKAKITLNTHGEVAAKCAGNIRLFEATGVGTCLVTDWKDNITDLFEPGKEIITYTSIEDCANKIKWLLENPRERNAIAMAGQKRTLEQHTIEKRALALNEILQVELRKNNSV